MALCMSWLRTDQDGFQMERLSPHALQMKLAMRVVLSFNIIMPKLCKVGKFSGRHIIGDENCAHLQHKHAEIMHDGQFQWQVCMPLFLSTFADARFRGMHVCHFFVSTLLPPMHCMLDCTESDL